MILTTIGLLSALAWFLSGFFGLYAAGKGWELAVSNGGALMTYPEFDNVGAGIRIVKLGPRIRGWDWRQDPPKAVGAAIEQHDWLVFAYRKHASRTMSGLAGFSLRLWVAAPVGLVAGGLLLFPGARRRLRSKRGRCMQCGYDLAGLEAGAKCPECGKGAGTTA